ncbi:MAG: histidine phosphatase family protein [Prochloraceae cyanobacterium]|nr:histidine phosphatase family protein [Prochloraceae cyanobacterium]
MNIRVILLRHGESTYNALKLYQGCSDESVLTARGCQQARMTGALLKNISFDAIYTSSLRRARETAREVLETIEPQLHPQIIKVDRRLREANLATWEGVPFQQVQSEFANDYRCWKQTPQNLKMKLPRSQQQNRGQEYIYPVRDLYDRVGKFWQEILPRHQNQTLLLAAHGGTNRALISTALGIAPFLFHTIQQSNCGISILNFFAAKPGKARLEALNLTTHISENLPKLKEGGKGKRLLLVSQGAIHPTQISKLAHLLEPVSINFSLYNEFDTSSAIANAILENHPETVQLPITQPNWGKIWQNTLSANNHKNNDELITGLVVASVRQIKTFFAKIFEIESTDFDHLQLQPGTISAIHYPNSEHPPIVQAINILGFNSPEQSYFDRDGNRAIEIETPVSSAIA